MNAEDRYYCHDCWDKIDEPAPYRCNRPQSHHPASAVKIGIVIEHADGSKTHIASDQFESIDLDAEGPHRWWHEQQQQAVQVPTQSHDTRPIKVGRHMK